MSIELLDLKAHALRVIKESFSNPQNEDRKFICVELNTETINLSNLIQYLPKNPKIYFKTKDQKNEFLGLGSSFDVNTPKQLDGLNKLIENEKDLVFLGARHFENEPLKSEEWSGFKKYHFFLPKVLFSNINGKSSFKVFYPSEILNSKLKQAQWIMEVEEYLSLIHQRFSQLTLLNPLQVPSYSDYERILNERIQELKKDQYKKIVLARKKVYYIGEDYIPSFWPEKFKDKTTISYSFYFEPKANKAFFSATPEKLFSLKSNILEIDSLAGTRGRSENPKEDLRLENELLSSKKELNEHRYVTQSISDTLKDLGLKAEVILKEKILKLPNVQHIYSKIQAKNSHHKFMDIMNSLHPTPAVGGLPKRSTLPKIKESEGFERGLYAAPVGVIGHNLIEFAVALRCALFENGNLHLFAGGGIVDGSSPKAEWQEAEEKMAIFIQKINETHDPVENERI